MYELKLGEVYPERKEGSSQVRIFAEDEFKPEWCVCVRRPYFRLRGKPVSPEEAINIIARTDDFFYRSICINGSISSGVLTMNYFGYAGGDSSGWVHPCGAVGQNYLFGYKWAEIREMASDMLDLAENFPYLDFIIAVSWWNEMSPKRHELMMDQYIEKCIRNNESCNDASQYYDDEDFTENIELGIWVHNGMIEFINPKLATELYGEYDRLYDGIDRRIFIPGYYNDFAPQLINRDFFRKCLNVYGIDDTDRFSEDVRLCAEDRY